MAGFKTVKVVIDGDGTVEFDQIGYKGKECQNDIQDLIEAMGEEKKVTRKREYYEGENVQVQQRF